MQAFKEEPITLEEQTALWRRQQLPTPHPAYYEVMDGKDLYALFEVHFGKAALMQHLLMEAIQYLWRCQTKGHFASDIAKVKLIMERILAIEGAI